MNVIKEVCYVNKKIEPLQYFETTAMTHKINVLT